MHRGAFWGSPPVSRLGHVVGVTIWSGGSFMEMGEFLATEEAYYAKAYR
jgi:hypothetical protein